MTKDGLRATPWERRQSRPGGQYGNTDQGGWTRIKADEAFIRVDVP